MILTVIIALESKSRSCSSPTPRERRAGPHRTPDRAARDVRELLILDVRTTDALQLFALSAAILALGGVYWVVRDQDRRERVAQGSARSKRPE